MKRELVSQNIHKTYFNGMKHDAYVFVVDTSIYDFMDVQSIEQTNWHVIFEIAKQMCL